jgi:hypothetical protein
MRHRVRSLVVVALAAWTGAGCATGRSYLGRTVTVVPVGDAAELPMRGELIAVEPERIWVLGKEHVVDLPLSTVQEVQVQRHPLTRNRGWIWTALGALITGGSLAVACGSVEDTEGCGGVFAVVAGSWLVLGGLPSEALDKSAILRIEQPTPERLRPYARFPQGPPAGVDLEALKPRGSAARKE